MMQMDETAIKKEHENGVSIIEPTQKIVDDILELVVLIFMLVNLCT